MDLDPCSSYSSSSAAMAANWFQKSEDFMEETCDSDCISEGFYGCGFSSGGGSNSVVIFMADDACSSTSDSECSGFASQEFDLQDSECSSALSFLQKASDDELGIPPPPQLENLQDSEWVDSVDFDLNFDDDFNAAVDEQTKDEQSLFWLRFLRS